MYIYYMIKNTEDIPGTLPNDQITKHFAWKIGFSELFWSPTRSSRAASL